MTAHSDGRPDLVATDIPFTPHGLSRTIVVDRADAEAFRELLSRALASPPHLMSQRHLASVLDSEHVELDRLRGEVRQLRRKEAAWTDEKRQLLLELARVYRELEQLRGTPAAEPVP
jgi:hypothetical protein